MNQADTLLGRVGARVRAARAARGLTGAELARRAQLSLRAYRQLEAGHANMSLTGLARVADALEIDLGELVGAPRQTCQVALVGLRGAGKSTVGPLVAQALDARFVELDDRIEATSSLSLAEIFALHGEAYYRRLETECLAAVLSEPGAVVVALSGGIVNNAEAWRAARRCCATVWLRAEPEDHMQRVLDQGDRRPMEHRENAMAELRALLASREPLYQQADVTVDTSLRTPEGVASYVVGAVTAAAPAPGR